MNRRGLFVTATDTGVGKTWISCRLIPALRKHVPLQVRKPVESGCIPCEDRGLVAADAEMLHAAAGNTETAKQVCRYRFEDKTSPARAAALAAATLRITDLTAAACATSAEAFLLVEGSGGFYSPIAQDGLNADLAQQLQLPLLLVCPDRLGCLSSALLAVEAAQRRGMKILAVAMNQLSAAAKAATEQLRQNNASELASHTTVPVFSIQYAQQQQRQLTELANHITEYWSQD